MTLLEILGLLSTCCRLGLQAERGVEQRVNGLTLLSGCVWRFCQRIFMTVARLPAAGSRLLA